MKLLKVIYFSLFVFVCANNLINAQGKSKPEYSDIILTGEFYSKKIQKGDKQYTRYYVRTKRKTYRVTGVKPASKLKKFVGARVKVIGKSVVFPDGKRLLKVTDLANITIKSWPKKEAEEEDDDGDEDLPEPDKPKTSEKAKTYFRYPCKKYLRGLEIGVGTFGRFMKGKKGAFSGRYHLAEDIWIPAGWKVRSVADGVVMYSDFSPTWFDKKGERRWGFGNVIVIEHKLDQPEGDMKYVCSFYVHLSKDRKVKVGDKVKRGQVIGYIGKSMTEENGLYLAHLHFGIHKGPYYQFPPQWKRQLVAKIGRDGLRAVIDGKKTQLKGEVEFLPYTDPKTGKVDKTKAVMHMKGQDFLILKDGTKIKGTIVQTGTGVTITTVSGEVKKYKSAEVKEANKLNIASVCTLVAKVESPKHSSSDIIGWCSGYGDKITVGDWLEPSTWIKKRMKKGGK